MGLGEVGGGLIGEDAKGLGDKKKGGNEDPKHCLGHTHMTGLFILHFEFKCK